MKREYGMLMSIGLLVVTMVLFGSAQLTVRFTDVTRPHLMIPVVVLMVLGSVFLTLTLFAFLISVFLPPGGRFEHPVLAAIASSDPRTISMLVVGTVLVSFGVYLGIGWPEGTLGLGMRGSIRAEDWWWILLLGLASLGFGTARMVTSRREAQ
jgi:hypothetical protein